MVRAWGWVWEPSVFKRGRTGEGRTAGIRLPNGESLVPWRGVRRREARARWFVLSVGRFIRSVKTVCKTLSSRVYWRRGFGGGGISSFPNLSFPPLPSLCRKVRKGEEDGDEGNRSLHCLGNPIREIVGKVQPPGAGGQRGAVRPRWVSWQTWRGTRDL